MMIFFVSISCVSPSEDLTETFPGAVIVPETLEVATLFVFMSARTPPFIVFTTLSLRSSIFARSTRNVVDHDAVFRRFLFREHEMIARSQQRFARDAADVETSAAEIFVLFDDGGLEAELAGADRGDITARPEPMMMTSNFSIVNCHSERSERSSLTCLERCLASLDMTCELRLKNPTAVSSGLRCSPSRL